MDGANLKQKRKPHLNLISTFSSSYLLIYSTCSSNPFSTFSTYVFRHPPSHNGALLRSESGTSCGLCPSPSSSVCSPVPSLTRLPTTFARFPNRTFTQASLSLNASLRLAHVTGTNVTPSNSTNDLGFTNHARTALDWVGSCGLGGPRVREHPG